MAREAREGRGGRDRDRDRDGGDELMDKLVTMGLVPEEQMMGMRMGLALFAKPAEGNPDQLTSEVEFREGGQIFANGQQIK